MSSSCSAARTRSDDSRCYMPIFPLASIPGFSGAADVPGNSSRVSVNVGLKDPLLFLPGNQTVLFKARHPRIAGNRHEIDLQATFAPPLSMCGGQIVVGSLAVT